MWHWASTEDYTGLFQLQLHLYIQLVCGIYYIEGSIQCSISEQWTPPNLPKEYLKQRLCLIQYITNLSKLIQYLDSMKISELLLLRGSSEIEPGKVWLHQSHNLFRIFYLRVWCAPRKLHRYIHSVLFHLIQRQRIHEMRWTLLLVLPQNTYKNWIGLV